MIIEIGKDLIPVEKDYLEWAGAKIKALTEVNADLLEALEAILPHADARIRGTTVGQPLIDQAKQAIEKARV